MKFEINQIGIIFSSFNNKDECLIQGVANKTAKGKIEIFSAYEEGLKNIEFFSHLFLVYIFDRVKDINLLRKPFLDYEYHGIFASDIQLVLINSVFQSLN